MKKKKNSKFHVLDLFCGAGGFSSGFRQAGFKIVAGIDNNLEALRTYAQNFPEADALQMDLSQPSAFEASEIKSEVAKKIDIIIGGPPCQGLSIAGWRLADDPRNDLYKAFLGFIKKVKPLAVVLENVPTIRSLHGGKVAEAITREFDAAGYRMNVFTLNAADYGVPQSRRRTFFVGLKNGKIFKIPEPTTAFSQITTKMAISDLPLLENDLGVDEMPYLSKAVNDYQKQMRTASKKIINHWAVEHKVETKRIISMVPDGGNYKDLPKSLQRTRKVNIAWTRMNSTKPCFTIDAGHNHHFHYEANRVPTVRECARIQSFPDNFHFLGKKTSQFRQVGNAVPPLLAKALAKALKDELR